MPTYDYQCDACEALFEVAQSIHDELLQDCPHCRRPKLRRLISGAGLIFKGSGFYVNDTKKTAQPQSDKVVPPKESTKGETTKTANNSQQLSKQSSKEEAKGEAQSKAAKCSGEST